MYPFVLSFSPALLLVRVESRPYIFTTVVGSINDGVSIIKFRHQMLISCIGKAVRLVYLLIDRLIGIGLPSLERSMVDQ